MIDFDFTHLDLRVADFVWTGAYIRRLRARYEDDSPDGHRARPARAAFWVTVLDSVRMELLERSNGAGAAW